MAAQVRLSFQIGEEEEEEGEEGGDTPDHDLANGAAAKENGAGTAEGKLAKEGKACVVLNKVGKDPTVETDFLPDRERERKEEELREQLKQEFLLRQQARARPGVPPLA
jgi:protein FAM50